MASKLVKGRASGVENNCLLSSVSQAAALVQIIQFPRRVDAVVTLFRRIVDWFLTATALLAGTRCCLERCLESLVKRVNRRARTDSPLGLSLARPRLLRVLAIVLASATASAMLALSAMLFAPVPSEGEPALPLLFLPLMLLVGALCLAVRPVSWLLVALFDAQAPPHHLAIARIVIFGCWWWDMVRAPRRPSALAAPVPATSTARERAVLFCKAQRARIVTARGATGARRYTDAVVVLRCSSLSVK